MVMGSEFITPRSSASTVFLFLATSQISRSPSNSVKLGSNLLPPTVENSNLIGPVSLIASLVSI